ncbi:MAG TPA: sensor histidine kinase [Rhodanobacteraceae bacterium]|nr:sensor histidine kinase [Rhodanobacteraceae bacterium]
MFFKIAPDSVIGRSCATQRSPRGRWIPVVMLVWTLWIFTTPIFSNERNWLAPTLVSFAIFLPLYWRAYFGPRQQVLWCALGIAALSFALTPFNIGGGECYLIYACAFFAFTGPNARVSAEYMVLAVLLYMLSCLLLGLPWPFVASAVLVSIAVGMMNIFFRRNQQQDAELRLSHDEVRRLAATAERERIGRDLHDLLGHTLSLVAVKSELAKRLLDRDPQGARREIAEVERVARDALAQVRSAVTGIRAAGLAAELASARLLLESAGTTLIYRRDERELPTEIETCLALTLREAVTNIQRHAHATRAEIDVRCRGDSVSMCVGDDGRGGIDAHGNGLTGMRERIEAMDGSLSIESQHRRGTRLEVVLPLPKAAAPQAKPAADDPAAVLRLGTLRHA